ncbi:MAG: FxLYD domain-containing protein, partial [Rhodospirillaceae bacterium]
VGLGEKLGAGLNLSKPTINYGTEKGKPTLIVEGVIANVEDKPRPVPMLKLILRDGENHEIQSAVAPPMRNELPAKERMKYKITVVDPSPLARSIAVIFIAPEEAGAKGAAPAH